MKPKNDKLEQVNLDCCPWCQSKRSEPWGRKVRGFVAVRCEDCDVVYIQNRLSIEGLSGYYANYLNEVHQSDKKKNTQRNHMYDLEYSLMSKFITSGKVLDVGCSNGAFLKVFEEEGFKCHGVEFGEAAAVEASKFFPVYYGEFPEIEIEEKFDVIIFRGVIEHVIDAKAYLKKAVSLLSPDGYLLITATPNRDSFSCNLYEEKWNQHYPEVHLLHLAERHLTVYLNQQGLKLLSEKYFYEETSYADPENDLLTVAEALKQKNNGEEITVPSPAFYKNMLTLIYQSS